MIRFQIVERPDANLQKTLVEAMRAGELRQFQLADPDGVPIDVATGR